MFYINNKKIDFKINKNIDVNNTSNIISNIDYFIKNNNLNFKKKFKSYLEDFPDIVENNQNHSSKKDEKLLSDDFYCAYNYVNFDIKYVDINNNKFLYNIYIYIVDEKNKYVTLDYLYEIYIYNIDIDKNKNSYNYTKILIYDNEIKFDITNINENYIITDMLFMIDFLKNFNIKTLKYGDLDQYEHLILYYVITFKNYENIDKFLNLNIDFNFKKIDLCKNSINMLLIKNKINEFRNIKIKDITDYLDNSLKIMKKFLEMSKTKKLLSNKLYINSDIIYAKDLHDKNSKKLDILLNKINFLYSIYVKIILYKNKTYLYEILNDKLYGNNDTMYNKMSLYNILLRNQILLIKMDDIIIDFTNIKRILLTINQLINAEFLNLNLNLNI